MEWTTETWTKMEAYITAKLAAGETLSKAQKRSLQEARYHIAQSVATPEQKLAVLLNVRAKAVIATGLHERRPATDRQVAYLASLLVQSGFTEDSARDFLPRTLCAGDASKLIDQLKAAA